MGVPSGTCNNFTSGGIFLNSNTNINLSKGSSFRIVSAGITYEPFSHYGLMTLSAASQYLCGTGNSGVLNAWTNIKVTAILPTLVLPDPSASLAGTSFYLMRSGITADINAITLKTFSSSLSWFNVSPNATNTSTYVLGSNWNKVGFVCVINYDATSTPYVWEQVLYQ